MSPTSPARSTHDRPGKVEEAADPGEDNQDREQPGRCALGTRVEPRRRRRDGRALEGFAQLPGSVARDPTIRPAGGDVRREPAKAAPCRDIRIVGAYRDDVDQTEAIGPATAPMSAPLRTRAAWTSSRAL